MAKTKKIGKEVEFRCGSTIESAFQKLHEEAAASQSDTWGTFNTHVINSTMTLNEMYVEITHKTKKEFDAILKKEYDEYVEYEKKAKEEAPRKALDITNKMIERGYIKAEDKDEFLRMAKVRYEDMYHGCELESMLEIIDILVQNKDNEKTAINKAHKKFMDQGHSGMSAGLTISLIRKYSPVLGNEFYNKYKL